jgi:HSP20 family protein
MRPFFSQTHNKSSSMSVLYYEPFYEIERFFDEAFSGRQDSTSDNKGQRRIGRGEGDSAPRSLKPRYAPNLCPSSTSHFLIFFHSMDLHENAEKNSVTATFEFPGLSKEDVQVDVNNGRLTVSAETKKDLEKDEHGYAVKERQYGKFMRTLQLPQGVKVCFWFVI